MKFSLEYRVAQVPHQRGGQWFVVPYPHLKYVRLHFMFGARLLHTSNVVFTNVAPRVLFPPVLRNPDDGPGVVVRIGVLAARRFKTFVVCATVLLLQHSSANVSYCTMLLLLPCNSQIES